MLAALWSMVLGALILLWGGIAVATAADSDTALRGLLLGIGISVVIVGALLLTTRRMLIRNAPQALTLLVLGGLLFKLVGLGILTGIHFSTRLPDGGERIALLPAFLGYLGPVFFGYAWQAKLVERANIKGADRVDHAPANETLKAS